MWFMLLIRHCKIYLRLCLSHKFLYIFFIDKVAAVEAAYAIKYKKKPPVLSTQQIVDCSLNKINLNGVVGNYGCNGGYYAHSLTFLKNSGARYSKNYPYTGTEGKCKSSSGPSVLKVTKIYTSAHQIGDVEAIKAALNKGPLMAYIYASNNFMEYGQGNFIDIEI